MAFLSHRHPFTFKNVKLYKNKGQISSNYLVHSILTSQKKNIKKMTQKLLNKYTDLGSKQFHLWNTFASKTKKVPGLFFGR